MELIEDTEEIIEGTCINYGHETFWSNQEEAGIVLAQEKFRKHVATGTVSAQFKFYRRFMLLQEQF